MKKRIIGLIVGLGLAVIAVVIIHAQIQEREQVIRQLVVDGELSEVTVAARNISRGSVIGRGDVALVRAPTRELGPGIVRDPSAIIGTTAAADILREQPIYSSMVRLSPEVEREVGVAQRIRGTRRAFTMSIDNIAAVGGQIRTGDRVDVIGSIQIPVTRDGRREAERAILTLFENIEVLNVGRSREAINSVTLSLTSEEVKILNYALEMGKVRLVLRSPAHIAEEGIAMQPFTFSNFMHKMHERMGIQPMVEPEPEVEITPPAIEIYRGGE